MEVERISGNELSEKLKSKNTKMAIIDVRDNDFVGGHIESARNIPSEDFDTDIDQHVAELKEYDEIVFHCMMSQIRAVRCSKRFANRMYGTLDEDANLPKVKILHGGFQAFVQLHRDQCQDVDSSLW